MKKVICFIFDFIAALGAFVFTDVIMYYLQSEDAILDLAVFIGFTIVFEFVNWLITKLVGLR